MTTPLRIAVLVSGSGTTLQNLLDRCAAGRLAARVVQVVSNVPGVKALERAAAARVPAAVVVRKEAGSREEFSRRIFDHCRRAGADIVCMAGFLQIITIPDDYLGRVMNIHPALIPAFSGKGFYGRHVHEAVLLAGVILLAAGGFAGYMFVLRPIHQAGAQCISLDVSHHCIEVLVFLNWERLETPLIEVTLSS